MIKKSLLIFSFLIFVMPVSAEWIYHQPSRSNFTWNYNVRLSYPQIAAVGGYLQYIPFQVHGSLGLGGVKAGAGLGLITGPDGPANGLAWGLGVRLTTLRSWIEEHPAKNFTGVEGTIAFNMIGLDIGYFKNNEDHSDDLIAVGVGIGF